MISVVIPVYNERDSLELLHAEIVAVAGAEKLDVEVIFVDDGSNDGSWEVIGALTRDNAAIHGIRFRRNFGKAAALSAGFHHVQGDVVVTLDADLQDDPREIPRFLAALAPAADAPGARKNKRRSTWSAAGKSCGTIPGTRSVPAGSSTGWSAR